MMNALTLWQPWAMLILWGIKTIETRIWRPPAKLLGTRIAIHAGKTIADRKSLEGTAVEEVMIEQLGLDWRLRVPTGAVIATAVVAKGYRTAGYLDDEYVRVRDGDHYFKVPFDAYGDFSDDRWLWMLNDVQPVDPPFYVDGRQKIWTVNFEAPEQAVLIG